MVRLPEFVFGVLVGRYTESMPSRLPPWACGAVTATIVATLYWTYYLPPTITETFVENGLYAPLFTLLIVTLAKSSRALLSGTTWVHLGNASYALYIIHMPIWGIFRFAASLSLIPSAEQSLTIYCCYLAVVLGGAQTIHAFIEQPLRHAIRKRLHAFTLSTPAAIDDRVASERAVSDVPNSGLSPLNGHSVLPAQAARMRTTTAAGPFDRRTVGYKSSEEYVDSEPKRPAISARSRG
jgi:peptidoglycan/LPS O-acetylase OafA/YrhL